MILAAFALVGSVGVWQLDLQSASPPTKTAIAPSAPGDRGREDSLRARYRWSKSIFQASYDDVEPETARAQLLAAQALLESVRDEVRLIRRDRWEKRSPSRSSAFEASDELDDVEKNAGSLWIMCRKRSSEL